MFSIIVACTYPQGGIGKNNSIPWHIPGELKHFAQVTKGGVVIMGRNTWNSLPRKPLPNRVNIIVSTTMQEKDAPNAVICSSLQTALDYVTLNYSLLPTFVIGGSALYREALLHADCNRVYVTRINQDVDCDTHFPLHILHERFQKVDALTKYSSYNSIDYSMVEFVPLGA